MASVGRSISNIAAAASRAATTLVNGESVACAVARRGELAGDRLAKATIGPRATLDAAAMAKAFDADAHPDVVAGNRSAADVRAELHEALAAGGGPVTRQLFEDYYDLQSITVDRDEQFEALVRSSWIALVRQKAAARKKRG
mmetsp:Transcript_26324/g.68431  ORF Transcript_26324/g.68431 Transcript_26324/m.68431 type:complete len:142 (+) Transcript_26324:152-577(+)